MIKITLTNRISQIIDPLDQGVLNQLCTECSYFVQGAEFSKLFLDNHWDGTKHLFNKRNQTFPTGLLSRVRRILEVNNIQYEIQDNRIVPIISTIPFYPPGPLREYQIDATKTMLEHTRGIVRLPTGSGKSLNIGDVISQTNVRTLVLAYTSAVFEQLAQSLEKSLRIPIGRIGAGNKDIQKVTVALIQSLTESESQDKDKFVGALKQKSKKKSKMILRADMIPFLSGVECVIYDETHHVAAESVQLVSSGCNNAYYTYGLSATPYRDDAKDILIECATGRKIVDCSASHLIKLGYLSKPTIRLVSFKHHPQPKTLKFKELYTQEVAENVERNKLICDIAESYINKGKSVLISVQRISHGKLLEESLKKKFRDKIRFANGDDDSEELLQVLRDLDSKKYLGVIGTSVFKEGVDIPSLDVLISAAAYDSSVASFQIVGRALRITPTKNTVDIFDIADKGCRYLSGHTSSRIKIYETEPEFVLRYCDENNLGLT